MNNESLLSAFALSVACDGLFGVNPRGVKPHLSLLPRHRFSIFLATIEPSNSDLRFVLEKIPNQPRICAHAIQGTCAQILSLDPAFPFTHAADLTGEPGSADPVQPSFFLSLHYKPTQTYS